MLFRAEQLVDKCLQRRMVADGWRSAFREDRRKHSKEVR